MLTTIGGGSAGSPWAGCCGPLAAASPGFTDGGAGPAGCVAASLGDGAGPSACVAGLSGRVAGRSGCGAGSAASGSPSTVCAAKNTRAPPKSPAALSDAVGASTAAGLAAGGVGVGRVASGAGSSGSGAPIGVRVRIPGITAEGLTSRIGLPRIVGQNSFNRSRASMVSRGFNWSIRKLPPRPAVMGPCVVSVSPIFSNSVRICAI